MSEALLGEGAAGVGFQIFLEFQCSHLVWKGAVPDQLPGFEFSGVGRFAGVMFRQPPLQIGSRTNVFLFGKVGAADDVDVPSVLTCLAERVLVYLGDCLATRSPLREC